MIREELEAATLNPEPKEGHDMSDNQTIIKKILETITRFRESVAGEVPAAVKTARFVAVGQAILALAEGNEDNIHRGHDEEIVRGLGAPGRSIISELFFEPRPGPRDPIKVPAELVPVVEALSSVGLVADGWTEADLVVEEPAG